MSDDPISKRFGNVGDGPISTRKATMAYIQINEDQARRKHDEERKAFLPKAPLPLNRVATINMVVSELIERDIGAWKALPGSVRDLMLTSPDKFTFIAGTVYPNDIPEIMFQGVRMKWNGAETWTVVGIEVR